MGAVSGKRGSRSVLPQLVAVALVAAVTVVASTAVEVASPSVRPAAAAPVAGGLGFTALAAPCRAVDTRSGGGALTADVTRSFQVGGPGSLAAQGGAAGGCGIPDGAGAVEVAVTAVGPVGNGFLRAFAAGDAAPNATIVNYTSGVGITNTGTIRLAASGTLDLSIKNFVGTTQVVVDVLGFFTTAGTGGYTPLASPCRVVDTRSGGGQVTAGTTRNVQVAGTGATFAAQGGTAGGCGVPDGVPAAVVSITAVGPVGKGFLRAGPNTGAAPAATVVNYTNGIGITNTGATALGNAATADLTIASVLGRTDVTVDVLGYYAPAAGSRYQTVTPCRAADTRFTPGGKMLPDTTRLLQVAGKRIHYSAQGASGFIAGTGCGVPDRAAAVAAAVTAVSPEGSGFARLFPAGGAANGTFLNFAAGRSITNAGALSLANGGLHDLAMKNLGATSHFVVDVLGYYEPPGTNPNPTAAIGSGSGHTCRVAVFGSVECWGENNSGQLGNGTVQTRTTPAPVVGLYGAIDVSARGAKHTCALLGNGNVRCWGANETGQLGDSTITARKVPTTVSGLSAVTALTTGTSHSCALLVTGTAECWGNNASGQLGDGTLLSRTQPISVIGLTGAVSIAAGSDHTCALLADGTAKCWGRNFFGQLGDGTRTSSLVPTAVAGLTGARSISGGTQHTCALLNDGTAKCWGDNSNGAVGDGTGTTRVVPTTVTGLTGATSVSVLGDNSCAVLADATAKCWGNNFFGQVGDGTTSTRRNLPTTVSGLSGVVALGSGNTPCAVTANGDALCWGENGVGQLGDGTLTNRTAPRSVHGVGGVVRLSAGLYHSCLLLGEGVAKCWGNNDNGNLGDNSVIDRKAPRTVTGLTGAVALAPGDTHTCALIFDGTAKCWGNNFFGQLGDGSNTTARVPTTVAGLSGAVGISAGANHTCAYFADATPKCWGDNASGQLGDSTTTARTVPTSVGGAAILPISLSAGANHTCAVLVDRTARCWGKNLKGQLGDSSAVDKKVPTTVTGLTDALAVDAGADHTCAVLGNGTVKCWGLNNNGQLGFALPDQTLPDQQAPATALGATGVVGVSAGSLHTCALLATGAARCWGDNEFGQVGDNTTTDRFFATSVSGLPSGVSIAVGGFHACALSVPDVPTCWGYNGTGALGDNTLIDRRVPTLVNGFS